MARIILVVPCYNEENRLDAEVFRAFAAAGFAVDFCLVDDGSADGTAQIIHDLATGRSGDSFVVELASNRGKAEAVRAGVLAALERECDYVGYWDADLATPLDEVERFVAILEQQEAVQVVFGSRVKLLGRSIERSPARHYLGRVFATTVSLVLDLPIYDTQCGAKLFRVAGPMAQTFTDPFVSRWIFDVELIARLKQSHGDGRLLASQIYELPLMCWRDVSGSKLKSGDFLKAIVELWRIRRRYLT